MAAVGLEVGTGGNVLGPLKSNGRKQKGALRW